MAVTHPKRGALFPLSTELESANGDVGSGIELRICDALEKRVESCGSEIGSESGLPGHVQSGSQFEESTCIDATVFDSADSEVTTFA